MLYSPCCVCLCLLYTHGPFAPSAHTSGPRGTYFDKTDGVVKACETGLSSLGSPGALDSASCYLKCPAGQSLASDGSTCADCARGKYAGEPLPTCKVCPSGRFEDSVGSTECKKCQLGKAVVAGVNRNVSSCMQCPEGHYGDVHDLQTCKACPNARYEDSSGSTKCKACPHGSYENLGTTGMVRLNQCIECGRGRYGTQNASTSSLSCVNCAPGKYSYVLVASECKPCPAGREALEPRTPICSPCATGKVRMGNDEACASCSNPSQYATVTADECKECGPGEHLNVNRSGCDRCPAGRFSETPGATSSSTCTSCPVSSAGCRGLHKKKGHKTSQ